MLHDNENSLPPDHLIGANFPPEPIETEEARSKREKAFKAARERIDLEVASADEWAAQVKTIEDEDAAKQLADKLDQIERLFKLYDGMRVEEKRPHDEAAAAVQKRWSPLLEKLLLCKKALKPLETAWHKLKQKRHDDEREARLRAAAEARRRADQLAEQAKANSANVVTNMANAMEAAQEAERIRQEAAAVPLRAQTRGSLLGRTRSLRTVWQASIVEQDLCYGHFRDHADVKALLQRLANAAARGGVRNPNLPGCWIFDTQE